MTRTARRGPDNKKKHEASDWSLLKPAAKTVPSNPDSEQTGQNGSDQRPAGAFKKVKGQAGKKHKNLKKGEKLLHTLLSKEQRREKRRQKRAEERALKKRCFKCRLPGHRVEDCMVGDSSAQGTGICYRCGSTEHKASLCKAKGSKDAMPYASCYVCGKQGHLARSCPDNPKGLYPSGGGCRTCGSVEHFQRDCPEYLAKQGISSKTLTKMSMAASVDAMDDDNNDAAIASGPQEHQKVTKKKKPKVIRF